MHSLRIGVVATAFVAFGCGAEVEEPTAEAAGAVGDKSDVEASTADLDANGDPRSEYAHRALPKGGEAFVHGSRDGHRVDPSDVSQGSLSDCWVLSPLIAIARANPAAIERLVRPRPDGAFDVTLYVGAKTERNGVVERAPKTFRVTPTFATKDDGTLAYAKPQDVGPNGPELWPLLVEKAYAQHFGRYDGPIPVLGRDLNGNDTPAFHALLPRGTLVTHDPGRETDEETIDVVARAFAAGQPVTGLTTIPGDSREADRWGIVTWHHYAIARVDPATKTIDLEDPVRRRTGATGLPINAFRRTFSWYHVGPAAR